MSIDRLSLKSTLQDALDDLSSARSSTGRQTRALGALEHLLVLVCVQECANDDLNTFLRLQDTFECNVPSRLLLWIALSTSKLEVLTGKGPLDHDRETEACELLSLLSQSLSIIQGITLIHQPSKYFLGRRYALEILLDLLLAYRHITPPIPPTATGSGPSTQGNDKTGAATLTPLSSIVLDTLLCILVDSSPSLRVFEECNGVQAVVKILKTAGTPREVRMKSLEFLYFYLMDETPSSSSNDVLRHPTHQPIPEPFSLSKPPASPTKWTATPPSPSKTAPTTPSRARLSSFPSKSRFTSKPFTPSTRPLGPSLSSSSSFSNTWGSISSFSSDLSSSTSSTTPGDSPMADSVPAPKTPPKLTALPLPQASQSNQKLNGKTPLRPPALKLRNDVDIDYEPISPRKPKISQIGSMGTPSIKLKDLRELSTGSRSMPILPNGGTMAKNASQYHDRSQSDVESKANERQSERLRVRSAEEKKEILGGMLGNVDALVEGVRKAGIWGLE